MWTVVTAQCFLFYFGVFLYFLFFPLWIYYFCKENIYTIVTAEAQKPHALWCFFFLVNTLKTTTFALVVIIFLFLLFCISQIFFSTYVFCCNQENIIILSGLRNNSPGKNIIYRPSVFIPKILTWTCVWKIPGISLSKTEVRVDWLIHLHSLWIPTMCWVPCRGQIPQKTLSLPVDSSYDAVLTAWIYSPTKLWNAKQLLEKNELHPYLKRLQILLLG